MLKKELSRLGSSLIMIQYVGMFLITPQPIFLHIVDMYLTMNQIYGIILLEYGRTSGQRQFQRSQNKDFRMRYEQEVKKEYR